MGKTQNILNSGVIILISYIESNSHFYLTADSEIMWIRGRSLAENSVAAGCLSSKYGLEDRDMTKR